VTIKKTTLKELGKNLPLGVLDKDNKHNKCLSFKPWRMKEEKELGRLAQENKNTNIGRHISMILATMCEKIGPHDFSQMKFEEKIIIISQMFVGDVFYAYCDLRKENIGNILEMIVPCPRCGHQFDFSADLNTLEVITAESQDEMTWEYDLKHPIEIRGKKITGFKLGLPLWNTIEGAVDTGAGEACVKDRVIRGCIRGIKGDNKTIIITPEELDELSKFDIERLVRKIDNNVLGPVMTLECKCDKCQAEIVKPIDWRKESFFGDSSQ
jgi:hypothetical protein